MLVLVACWVVVFVLVVLAVVFVLGSDFQCFGFGHCFYCHVCLGLFLILCSLLFAVAYC